MLELNESQKEILGILNSKEGNKISERDIFSKLSDVNSYKKDINELVKVLNFLLKNKMLYEFGNGYSISPNGRNAIGFKRTYYVTDVRTTYYHRQDYIAHRVIGQFFPKMEEAFSFRGDIAEWVMTAFCMALNRQCPSPSIEEAEMFYEELFGNLDIEADKISFFDKFKDEEGNSIFSSEVERQREISKAFEHSYNQMKNHEE